MKYKFEKVVPIYTGGGVYCYYGKMDKYYFLSCDDYWVEFVDFIPFDDEQIVSEDMWHEEWIDEHIVKRLETDDETNEFLVQMFNWIIHEDAFHGYIKDGNYDIGEIEMHLERIKEDMHEPTFTITCYGRTTTYKEHERKKMRDYYLQGMMATDGSERERYTNIYLDLLNGLENASDE